ncbi:MAG: hypothetical protein JO301_01395 [Chitinophagaceae bacterium]|nr:hypothetical protein [Chitinophagaceae bacterium]
MKKLLLTAFVAGAFLFSTKSEAQVRFNVNLNIGRPSWGMNNNPYANQRGDFYYLPEIDCYYDIPHRQFIYNDGRRWINSFELPYMYRGYDLNRGYKVVINEPRPYLRADMYRQRYNSYYNNYRNQMMRNDHHDDRFDGRRDNQHFDNRRFENDRDRFYNNNGGGRFKTERGRF